MASAVLCYGKEKFAQGLLLEKSTPGLITINAEWLPGTISKLLSWLRSELLRTTKLFVPSTQMLTSTLLLAWFSSTRQPSAVLRRWMPFELLVAVLPTTWHRGPFTRMPSPSLSSVVQSRIVVLPATRMPMPAVEPAPVLVLPE